MVLSFLQATTQWHQQDPFQLDWTTWMQVLFLILGQTQLTESLGSTNTYSRGGLITLEVRGCWIVCMQLLFCCQLAEPKFYELLNVLPFFLSVLLCSYEGCSVLISYSFRNWNNTTCNAFSLSISELSVPLGGKAGWPSQVIGQSTFFVNKNSTSKFFHKGDVSSSAAGKNHSPFVAAAGMTTVTHQEDINITQKIDDLRAWLDSAQATSTVLSNANKWAGWLISAPKCEIFVNSCYPFWSSTTHIPVLCDRRVPLRWTNLFWNIFTLYL